MILVLLNDVIFKHRLILVYTPANVIVKFFPFLQLIMIHNRINFLFSCLSPTPFCKPKSLLNLDKKLNDITIKLLSPIRRPLIRSAN